MKTTVAGFLLRNDNSAFRNPIASAELACGHLHACAVKPHAYACGACGRATTVIAHGSCPCGSRSTGFRLVRMSNPHLAEDRITQVGDAIDCTECDNEARQIEWLKALPAEDVQHARFKMWCGVGQYHFYRRDVTSPTGVLHIGSVTATKAIDEVLRAKRISPLSPTEAR